MARIALVGRELWPFVEGGGIGRYIWTLAGALAHGHEVVVVTTAAHRPGYERLDGDPPLPSGVELVFVEEPVGDVSPQVSHGHAWSVRLLETVRELGADLVEFGDYLGDGFATVHARRSGDRALRRTSVVVRAHTSAEIAMALNESPADPGHGVLWAMERFAIRHADAFVWPGGDVLDRYRAFYGGVAEPTRLPLPVRLEGAPAARDAPPPAGGPLRLLFLNRLERRKGIVELVEALAAAPDADVRLTVVGGDTPTGPGGGSMREHVERLLDGDERVDLRDGVPHSEVAALIASHHAVAVPVRWETFSYVTREALAANRPVLATPSGAIPEVVVPGRSGWLTRDLPGALSAVDATAAGELAADGGPRAVLEESLVSDEEQAAAYAALAAGAPRRAARSPSRVTAIVAVCAGDADLERTLGSLSEQAGMRVGVTLVVQPEAVPGTSALLRAERFVVHAGGRVEMWAAAAREVTDDLVLLVPAGAELAPEFTRRAAAALSPRFAYATAWVRGGHRPWRAPFGGDDLAAAGVDSGASVALVRRDAVRAAATERELWSRLPGVVIHEALVRRLPRRPLEPGEPAHAGAPDPDAVAAAFGDLLSAGAGAARADAAPGSGGRAATAARRPGDGAG